MGWGRLVLSLSLRAIVSPSLARDLIRVAWAFRAREWYSRWPFLPLPSREYVRWRMYTIYGNEDAVPPIGDIVRYARWVTRQR